MVGMEPGDIIRTRREELGWSQHDLGKRVGVSQVAIKKIEAGTTQKSKFLPKVAEVLGLSLSDLDRSLAPRTETANSDFPAHSAGMELGRILERVEARVKAVGISADAASKRAGKPDAIRNLRRAVKSGNRSGISTDTLAALAPVLECTVAWLIDGEQDIWSEDVAANLPARQRAPTMRVVGYVGAGSEAHFYAVSHDDYEEVPRPTDASNKAVALEIRGKSWGPLMESWLVYYDDVRSPVTPDLLNRVCIVGLADDRVLIKEIRSDGNGGYNLYPNTATDEVIYDADIEWAAKVVGMKPR